MSPVEQMENAIRQAFGEAEAKTKTDSSTTSVFTEKDYEVAADLLLRSFTAGVPLNVSIRLIVVFGVLFLRDNPDFDPKSWMEKVLPSECPRTGR